MALDMSDVLTDADLVETLALWSGESPVDQYGRGAPVFGVWVPFSGVVTSGKGSKIERTDGASRAPGQILVTSLKPFRIAGSNYDVDRILRAGEIYALSELRKNTGPGGSFYSAVCVPEILAGV